MSTALTINGLAAAARAGTLVPKIPRPLSPAMGRALGAVLVGDVRQRFQTGTDPTGKRWRPLGFPRPEGGTRPLLNTGLLRTSITSEAGPDWVSVGTSAPQAALMNFGGTVRPRRAKHLAIPLTVEARRTGSPRRYPGRLRLVRAKGKRDGGVLLDERGVAQWALVRSVTIPARPFLGVSDAALSQMAAMLAEMGAPGG